MVFVIIYEEFYFGNFEPLKADYHHCAVQQKVSDVLKNFFVRFDVLEVPGSAFGDKILKSGLEGFLGAYDCWLEG